MVLALQRIKSVSSQRWWPLLAAIVCQFCAAGALAQQPSTPRTPPTYKYPAQIQALAAAIADLRDSPLGPKEYLSLSRLLAEPSDQISWLIETVATLQQSGKTADAKALAESTRQRFQYWQKLGKQVTDPEPAFASILREPEPVKPSAKRLAEVVDPAEFATLAAKPESLDQLSPGDEFIVFARGKNDGKVAAKSPVDQWARSVVGELAGNATLPNFVRLVALMNGRPAEAVSNAADANGAVAAITSALLVRALGFDGQDMPSLGGEGDAAAWAGRAELLERQYLWRWAALARLLEAASSGGGGRSAAAAKAAEQWGNVQRVDGSAWPAVAGWLARVTDNAQLDKPGELPLSSGSRARGRAARSAAEQAFTAARARNDESESFKQMQLAKAAEAGVEGGTPLTIAELRQLLRDPGLKDKEVPRVHVFVELLKVGDGWYGYATGSMQATFNMQDGFFSRWIGPLGDAQAVLAEALGEVKRGFKDGKIVIAPDAELRITPAENLQVAGQPLMARVSEGRDSFIIYIPTAAALSQRGGWKPEQALRMWYQTALAGGAGRSGVLQIAADGGVPRLVETRQLPGDKTTNYKCMLVAINGSLPAQKLQVTAVIDLKRKGQGAGLIPIVLAADAR